MPGIVEFPSVVQEALARFGGVVANEPERQDCAEYLRGLLVAQKKVRALNAELAETTDQGCLNRLEEWAGMCRNSLRSAWSGSNKTPRCATTLKGSWP
jgi:hypothetical protein